RPGPHDDVPGVGPLPLAQRAQQRALRPQAQAGPEARGAEGSGRILPAPGRPREIPEILHPPALRRHEAAGGAGPVARAQPARPADGRALRRPRRPDPRAALRRLAAHLAGAQEDHRLRAPQRPRGGLPGRPGRALLAPPGPNPAGVPHRPAAATGHQQRRPRAARHHHHRRPEEPRPGQGGRGMKRTLKAVAFFAGLVIIWQVLCSARVWSVVVLPSPVAVGEYLWGAVQDGTLGAAIVVTLRRLLFGYAVGLAIGLPTGLLTARFRVLHDTVGLLALGLQTLPSVCWVPLSLLWFGQTEAAMFFVVVMGTVWSVIIATEGGVRNLPPIYDRAARTMGSRGLHTWLRVILPAALPYVVGGMKQGWAFAWRSLMAAEIFVTILSGFGLGQLLHYGRELNAMDQVIGVMLVLLVIGLLADKILFSPWERMLHRRWGTAK